MWITRYSWKEEQAGWRMCQPTSERATLTLSSHHCWLTPLKTCSFFFSPSAGCQRHCHWQGEATLSKEGHMWLQEEGRMGGGGSSVKSLTEFLSWLSRQVLTVNTPLISLCIFMNPPSLITRCSLMSQLPNIDYDFLLKSA